MKSQYTLEDIAKKLNISASTVSRAVNNKSSVKKETRDRIMKALKEYNYTPNEVARSLKLNATNLIGIIIPDIRETTFANTIKGIDKVISAAGYSIIVCDSNESKTKEAHYLDILYQRRVDALVLATVELKGRQVLRFLEDDIPVVFIDNLPKIDRSIDAVLIDNMKASELAINRLVSLGHDQIATIIGSIEETTGYDRMIGYERSLTIAGVKVNRNLIMYGDYKEESGYNCMRMLLDNRDKEPFTAVYVTSEMMSVGALKAIYEYGLKIPDDLSFIGFDVYDKTGLINPGIDTIMQPANEIGLQVAELLLKRLENKDSPTQSFKHKLLLDPYIELKQSCKLYRTRKTLTSSVAD